MFRILISLSLLALSLKPFCQIVLPIVSSSDSNAFQSKWQHDTCRANIYTALAGKQPALGNASVTNAMLAGSIDLTSKVTGVLPFANGGIGSTAATSATTGAMTVNMTTEMITITPTGACTFNASGGVAGQRLTFLVTTSGTSSFTLTWGTNFRTVSTLATGTTSGRLFAVTFLCTNGTQWVETNRTAAMP